MSDTDEITALRAENERLRADIRLAIMSDSDECKALSQEVERLVKSRNRWGQKYNALLEKHKRLRAVLEDVYMTTRCDKTAAKARAALEGK